MKDENVKIAFIGGSGLYEVEGIDSIIEKEIHTPFGKPSDKIVIGSINGVRCAPWEKACFSAKRDKPEGEYVCIENVGR